VLGVYVLALSAVGHGSNQLVFAAFLLSLRNVEKSAAILFKLES
jgi:hypothetical protein